MFNVQLTPRATRPLSAQQIAQQLRGPLGRFPGFRATVNVPASLQIGGFRGNSNYNINVQSLNYDELYTWAPKLEAAMAEVPEVQDVSDNMDLKSPRVNMTIDRDKAAARRAERDADHAARCPTASASGSSARSTASGRSSACCSRSIRSIRSGRSR